MVVPFGSFSAVGATSSVCSCFCAFCATGVNSCVTAAFTWRPLAPAV